MSSRPGKRSHGDKACSEASSADDNSNTGSFKKRRSEATATECGRSGPVVGKGVSQHKSPRGSQRDTAFRSESPMGWEYDDNALVGSQQHGEELRGSSVLEKSLFLAPTDHHYPSVTGDDNVSNVPSKPSGAQGDEVTVEGSIITFREVEQLRSLVSQPPVSPAPTKLESPLQLHAGETVLFAIHCGEEVIADMREDPTSVLCACRIFCLDLRQLPPRNHGACQSGDIAGSLRCSLDGAKKDLMQFLCLLPLLNSDRVDVGTPAPPPKEEDATASQEESNKVASSLDDVNLSWSSGNQVELPMPVLVLWRATGGPADEYVHSKDIGNGECYTVTPCGAPLAVKQLTSIDQVYSFARFPPVYTVEHLLRSIGETSTLRFPYDASEKMFTLLYLGASWCPPCMRILKHLPAMVREDFCNNLMCVKADMDLAGPIFSFFGVEIIPTFIVLNNDVLRGEECLSEFLRDGVECRQHCMEVLHSVLRKSEVSRIQESQVSKVRMFVERAVVPLRF
uniref:Thioredoxin domain-containing protein n=1 Tax=Trypanosoma congolense (strain IL3000) TaxID=1068625 RepID=G0UW02_TRYCI|nr:conserved hypothetical protein [Trypanosoma congolense IL3000]